MATDNFAWANSPAKLIVDACMREMASFNDFRNLNLFSRGHDDLSGLSV
jgi:hypothetical protein